MSIEQKIKELGLEIREYVNPDWPFTTSITSGNLLFVSGHTPTIQGKPQYQGLTGSDVDLETAQKAGIMCLENCLGSVRMALGSLDKVKRVVKVNGFVASAPGFSNQAVVMNPVSEILGKLFGEKHARAALGVASLPGNVPVEIEMIVEI